MIVYCHWIFTFLSPCACDLHRPTRFHPIGQSTAKLWRHIDFSSRRPWCHKSTSGCSLVMTNCSTHYWQSFEKIKIYPYTIFRREISIHGCVINRYFRFRKTVVHHIGIVLPVSIFIYLLSSALRSSSAYEISSKSLNQRRSNDLISVF